MSGYHEFSVWAVGRDANNDTFWVARAVARRGDDCCETLPTISKAEAHALADRLNKGEAGIELRSFSCY